MKKLPLFQKLKEFINVTRVEEVSKPPGCEVHNEPDNFYCSNCQVLCCSKCAIFGIEHKGHEFIEIEQIYDIKKAKIPDIKTQLCSLKGHCGLLLDKSEKNINASNKSLLDSKMSIEAKIAECMGEYQARCNEKMKEPLRIKKQIEGALAKTNSHIDQIDKISSEKEKSLLVKCIGKIETESDELVRTKESFIIPDVLNSDEIENDLVPTFISKK